uniref:GOLD domain-containing protein n=1 Tax=Entomoneis paludosa TaxID=265537 RepID=A0A7S2YQA0_9STRA
MLWLGVVLLLCDESQAFSSVATVKPYHDECLLIRTSSEWKKDQKENPRYVWGHYELLSESADAKPLVVYISTYDMDKMLYKSKKAQASGHFDVRLEAGKRYWFCIVNHQGGHYAEDDDDYEDHPDDKPRKVGFSLDMVTHDEFDYTDLGGNPIPQKGEKISKAHEEAKERADHWMFVGRKLQMRLGAMKSHFDYLRVREADHRALTEKTFTDILTWTFAEAITVAFVAVGQIMYFRRFIERSRQYVV